MLSVHEWCLQSKVDKAELSTSVRKALYASKICSYAQGLNIIRAKSISMGWNIEMGELTRIWKVHALSLLLFVCRQRLIASICIASTACAANICNWLVRY